MAQVYIIGLAECGEYKTISSVAHQEKIRSRYGFGVGVRLKVDPFGPVAIWFDSIIVTSIVLSIFVPNMPWEIRLMIGAVIAVIASLISKKLPKKKRETKILDRSLSEQTGIDTV